MRHDQCRMADHRDHRMPPIHAALAHVSARMSVHIGEQHQLILPAQPPQLGVAITVELNGATLIGVCVKVIIAGEPRHFADSTLLPTEEKGAAFPLALPATSKC